MTGNQAGVSPLVCMLINVFLQWCLGHSISQRSVKIWGLWIAEPLYMPKGYELKSQVKISTEDKTCIWSGQKEYVLRPINTPSGHLTSVCYSLPRNDSFSKAQSCVSWSLFRQNFSWLLNLTRIPVVEWRCRPSLVLPIVDIFMYVFW